MTFGLRILLIALSGLLIAREVGTPTLSVHIEITEESASTEKEISIVQQQAVIKKIIRPITLLAKYTHYKSIELTPNIARQTTHYLWLQHRALLI
ncbi:MAG: hypothetical protein MUF68_05980 [Cyclobacteriaceae bacterium]|jgi:hypothetical protein|nr:hypothetical protein [Cyclobacteriaceae bacterium]